MALENSLESSLFKRVILKNVVPLNKEIGRGSYGRIFTVKYVGLLCAAKEIHSILLEADEESREAVIRSFLRECYHCSELRHPNIVQFIGVYYKDDSSDDEPSLPIMVMELMDQSLTSLVEKKKGIEMKVKMSILHDVSLGLSYLHSQDEPIVHRDLSPNNILLTNHIVAKISDLGIAMVLKSHSEATNTKKLTKVPGTQDFMAPETFSDDPSYDTSIDVFSYAGIALHVVCEEWPRPTQQTKLDSKTGILSAFTEVERRQKYFDKMSGKVSTALKPLLKCCLNNNPLKRPSITSVSEKIESLKLSLGQLQECDRHGENMFNSRDLQPAVGRDYQAVKKDNEFIYNDRVPSASSLDAIPKATIAKPIRLGGPASNFVDVFANLLPVEVSRAMGCYSDKRDQLVTMEVQKLKEATLELQAVLNSLNLPACIEEGGGEDVPKSLVEKGDVLREKGGVEALQRMISELPELLQRNKEILNEVVRSLDEEEREDTSLKERFKDKWDRMPSGKLTEKIRAQVTKYRTHLQRAEQADVTVRSKYDQHISMMVMLCKPANELAQLIPKPTKQAAIATGSKVVSDLRALLDEVLTLNKERDSLTTRLKEQSADDIVTKFLTALKEEGVVDEASLSDAHLSLIYDPLKEQVEESLQCQQHLVAKIQMAHQAFVQECGQDSSGRDEMLKQLASSFHTFNVLEGNLTEGTKFYNNLTSVLVELQSRVNDMQFVRNTEKDGLLKELQTSLAQVPPEQPVAPPRPTPLPRKQVSPQVLRGQQPTLTPPVATPPVQQPVATHQAQQPSLPPAKGQPPLMHATAPPPAAGSVPYYPQYYARPQHYAYQPPPQGYPMYAPPYQHPGAPPPRGAQPPPAGYPYYQPPPPR